MTALARNQVNTISKLNWYITVNGVLTDVFEIGFQIWDISAGSPGTQVFPALSGDWEQIEASAGHFGVGSYYAYDTTELDGWQVPLAEPLGTHQIKWRWKINASASFQQGTEEWEVLPESVGATDDTYCTLDDIRALGITELMADDDTVLATIDLAQQIIDRLTRQWFTPKTLQFKFDGTDSDAIHLAVPIIELEWLKINDSPNNLEPGYYRVYNQRTYPDDRRNPRIKLIGFRRDADIFTAPMMSSQFKFRKGRQNNEMRGTFGFVEANGQTPMLIKESCKRVVVERLSNPAYGTSLIPPPAPPPGVVAEEETDGHRLRYAVANLATRKSGVNGVVGDYFVQDALRLYRGPIGIATPAHWTYG